MTRERRGWRHGGALFVDPRLPGVGRGDGDQSLRPHLPVGPAGRPDKPPRLRGSNQQIGDARDHRARRRGRVDAAVRLVEHGPGERTAHRLAREADRQEPAPRGRDGDIQPPGQGEERAHGQGDAVRAGVPDRRVQGHGEGGEHVPRPGGEGEDGRVLQGCGGVLGAPLLSVFHRSGGEEERVLEEAPWR